MGTIGRIIWMTLFVFGMTYGAGIVLGQEIPSDAAHMVPDPPAELPWWGSGLSSVMSNFPDINAWLIATLMFLMTALRASSELLAFIASKTETKSDDKWAAILAKCSWWASSMLGWFGGGMSKKLMDKKIDGK